jgi:hypothetical protein
MGLQASTSENLPKKRRIGGDSREGGFDQIYGARKSHIWVIEAEGEGKSDRARGGTSGRRGVFASKSGGTMNA